MELPSRQRRLVLSISGSQTAIIDGSRNTMQTAEISVPLANIMQMLLIISIMEIRPTPNVAQNSTIALVMIEESAEEAAFKMAVLRSRPFCSSSLKRVVIRMA